jgi:NADH-quinone oxidoreductase subunit E
MPVTFKPEVVQEFEDIASRYPVRRAALLPALWLAQREFGWISLDSMRAVAELVGCSPVQVLETASFYTLYHKQKPGQFHLQVCQTISCLLNGSEEIKKTIEERLKLKPGEVTADGKFSYQPVECLAACHQGPCMRVNDDYYEKLTPESIGKLIDELSRK